MSPIRILCMSCVLSSCVLSELHNALRFSRETNHSTTVKILSVMLAKGLVVRDESARPGLVKTLDSCHDEPGMPWRGSLRRRNVRGDSPRGDGIPQCRVETSDAQSTRRCFMRVLLVEDSESLRRSVVRALQHAGYVVDAADDGEKGLLSAELTDYDAIVLDIMLPKLDGLALLRRLRAAGRRTHVLLLTARDTVANRVEGLRQGADDYLVKPFALEELLARVEALCRRANRTQTGPMCIGGLEIDLSARRLHRGGVEVELTAREWRLLECLALRAGQIVPRAEIEQRIYDELAEPMSNVVDAAIYGLRRKIGTDLIRTRRGLGYMLDAEVS